MWTEDANSDRLSNKAKATQPTSSSRSRLESSPSPPPSPGLSREMGKFPSKHRTLLLSAMGTARRQGTQMTSQRSCPPPWAAGSFLLTLGLFSEQSKHAREQRGCWKSLAAELGGGSGRVLRERRLGKGVEGGRFQLLDPKDRKAQIVQSVHPPPPHPLAPPALGKRWATG